jgi:hypothetical protein
VAKAAHDPFDKALDKELVFNAFKNYVNAATGGIADNEWNLMNIGLLYGKILQEMGDAH